MRRPTHTRRPQELSTLRRGHRRQPHALGHAGFQTFALANNYSYSLPHPHTRPHTPPATHHNNPAALRPGPRPLVAPTPPDHMQNRAHRVAPPGDTR